MKTETKPLFVVRKITEEEVPAAIAILEKWNMAPVQASSDIPVPERDSLILENTFVAIGGGRIIGVCSFLVRSVDTAETASLAVDPDYKGRGVGFELQSVRLKEMRDRGFKWVHTETDRPETISWYKRYFGYREVGKIKKKHAFSRKDIDWWTILRLDLDEYFRNLEI